MKKPKKKASLAQAKAAQERLLARVRPRPSASDRGHFWSFEASADCPVCMGEVEQSCFCDHPCRHHPHTAQSNPWFSPPALQYVARLNPPKKYYCEECSAIFDGRGHLCEACRTGRFVANNPYRFSEPSPSPSPTERAIRLALDLDPADRVWRGFDAGTGETGWHVQRFGRNAHCVGTNEREVAQFLRLVREDREREARRLEAEEARRYSEDQGRIGGNPAAAWHPGGGMTVGGAYRPGSGRFHHHRRPAHEFDYGAGRWYGGQWYPGGGHYESNPADLYGNWEHNPADLYGQWPAHPTANPYRFSEPSPNPAAAWHPGGGMSMSGEYHPGSGRFHHHRRPRHEYDHGAGRWYGGQWYPGGGHYESNPGCKTVDNGAALECWYSNPGERREDVLCSCGWGRMQCPVSQIPDYCPVCSAAVGLCEDCGQRREDCECGSAQNPGYNPHESISCPGCDASLGSSGSCPRCLFVRSSACPACRGEQGNVQWQRLCASHLRRSTRPHGLYGGARAGSGRPPRHPLTDAYFEDGFEDGQLDEGAEHFEQNPPVERLFGEHGGFHQYVAVGEENTRWHGGGRTSSGQRSWPLGWESRCRVCNRPREEHRQLGAGQFDLWGKASNPPVESNGCYGVHFHGDPPPGLFEAAHGRSALANPFGDDLDEITVRGRSVPVTYSKGGRYHRARVADPDEFSQIRTKTLSESKGIKALIGRHEGAPGPRGGRTEIQSYLFDATRYTPQNAVRWLEGHGTPQPLLIDVAPVEATDRRLALSGAAPERARVSRAKVKRKVAARKKREAAVAAGKKKPARSVPPSDRRCTDTSSGTHCKGWTVTGKTICGLHAGGFMRTAKPAAAKKVGSRKKVG